MTRRSMGFETRAYLAERRRAKRGNSAAQLAERRRATADKEAADWNAAHPVGTPVTLRKDLGDLVETRTRSVAWRIGDHASVMVEGISGGYLLERVTPR